jgi:hypothetical protein
MHEEADGGRANRVGEWDDSFRGVQLLESGYRFCERSDDGPTSRIHNGVLCD